MRGGRKWAKPACGRPLDGRVRALFHEMPLPLLPPQWTTTRRATRGPDCDRVPWPLRLRSERIFTRPLGAFRCCRNIPLRSCSKGLAVRGKQARVRSQWVARGAFRWWTDIPHSIPPSRPREVLRLALCSKGLRLCAGTSLAAQTLALRCRPPAEQADGPARDDLARIFFEARARSALTFDMRGVRKQAKLACGRPLDGRVRHFVRIRLSEAFGGNEARLRGAFSKLAKRAILG
jgi:hypothetical protein